MTSLASRTEDRSPTWCERCQRFHPWTPPWPEAEKAIIEALGQQIADEIDREIMEKILNEAR